MLDSDSGSSDLSEASSLSSDNSSGSEADVTKNPQPARSRLQQQQPHTVTPIRSVQHPNHQHQQPIHSSYNPATARPVSVPLPRPLQRNYSSSSGSGSGSDTGDSSGSDSSIDQYGSRHHSSKGLLPKPQKAKATNPLTSKNAPISLSASQPVYSQEIMDGSLPTAEKFQTHSSSLASSRGRGRGRGRVALASHGSRKYDAAGVTVIDFEASSPPPEDAAPPASATSTSAPPQHFDGQAVTVPRNTLVAPTRKKKEATAKTKTPKAAGGTNNKQKPGARKVGRPKSVSKDVYCICRGPYDGIEFMIACDRCEEWFHGRCIGMKPQDAKKNNYYYCDTCQRIRKMFGVTTSAEETTKTAKTKAQNKKSVEKQAEKQQIQLKVSSNNEVFAFLPQAASAPTTAQVFHSGGRESLSNRAGSSTDRTQYIPPPQPHNLQSSKAARYATTSAVQDRESSSVTVYDTPSNTTAQATKATYSHINNSNSDRTIASIRSVPMVVEDDEDEDVCPVCEFQCTCNTSNDISMEPAISPLVAPTTFADDSHGYSAIKVPFQPSLGPQASQEHHPSLSDAIDTVVIRDDESDDDPGNSFHTSHKNPMSTPASQRRPSILRRGGKGIGKAPYLMHVAKSANIPKSRGKGLKSGKAAMYFYRQSAASDSESEASDAQSDLEEKEGYGSERSEPSHVVSKGKNTTWRRARYVSCSDDDVDGDVDDTLSLSSSSSLSDFEDDAAQDVPLNQQYTKDARISPSTARKGWSQARLIIPESVTSRQSLESSTSQSAAAVAAEDVPTVNKKRGPGRPKKQKDPLVISREDEQALYTPAVASRKLGTGQVVKRGPNKVVRTQVKNLARSEFPFIAYDPEVAEVVKALNATDSHGEDDSDALQMASSTPIMESVGAMVLSETDIFGDGDLSDELSGDLSDILSEDLDDLSDDGLDFSSSDEGDEASSSSSPREFHYSELEEQDESLLDSDSSINSISTGISDSSDSASDSENDAYPQDLSGDDEDQFVFEHEGSEDLIDDEELMRLDEQERLLLAKAHNLHDVFSEEDSDPGRNPFESSEDDDDDIDDMDERRFESDEGEFTEGEYSDEYFEDEYEVIDEQAILEQLVQLAGVQADMQALMMIPPEQQEQLLLLQHYAETHRHQQEQLDPQYQQQHVQEQELGHQLNLPQQVSPIVGLLPSSDLLTQFDAHVPDLDAVSELLAASLASSIASSMAESMAGNRNCDESLLSSTEAVDNTTIIDDSATMQSDSHLDRLCELQGAADNASAESSLSVSQGSSGALWSTPPPPTPDFLTTIPTPANTPTPPGATSEASSSLSTTAGAPAHQQMPALVQVEPNAALNEPKHTLMPPAQQASANVKLQITSIKVQSLPNSLSYKPLSSVMAVPTIAGRPIQPILPKLAPGESLSGLSPFAKAHAAEAQIAHLNQVRIQTGELNLLKEAAQRVPGGLHSTSSNSTGASVQDVGTTAVQGSLGGEMNPDDGLVSGDTTDDASPSMHAVELRKRKSEETKMKETVLNQGKRRRLSVVSVKAGLARTNVSTVQDTLLPTATPLSGNEDASTLSSCSTTTPVESLLTSSASMSPLNGTTTDQGDTPSASRLTSTEFDFTKANMPFIDPAARILTFSNHKHGSNGHHQHHTRKASLKGKEPKHSEAGVLPMDDLLDTSALYGRSSSRSPSPNRVGAGDGEGDTDMSQSILKDLNRWERVPIGTFRRSRRPSSPYVGLQGALKSGNVNMPATLLSGHQQDQQLLYQESNRLHRKPNGVRKHRATSSASDVSSTHQRKEGSSKAEGHRSMQDPASRSRQRRPRASTITSMIQTPPSIHAGMLMEDLTGFGPPDSQQRISGLKELLHRPHSNLGLIDGSMDQPLRRKRRTGSNGPRPGLSRASSNQQLSTMISSGLNMDLRTGLGIGFAALGGSGMSTPKSGAGSRERGRVNGGLDDLMTDSTQLPSSACPTPLHSPLFSATGTSDRVHHHTSGEAVIGGDKVGLGEEVGSQVEEALVSHLELDIGKEMDGFHERLLAKSRGDATDAS
ncbi:hypothetical protein BG011_006576 [Mortierella polycephala]|uniref:PHD-type domain-containing protein n=1 Tax=Mortierella polycephala TaxID=41804 RepID=A0A9P6TYU2_9FUNG|nr:hypothetical protein BG011_006576 [Mortierella polycephala]